MGKVVLIGLQSVNVTGTRQCVVMNLGKYFSARKKDSSGQHAYSPRLPSAAPYRYDSVIASAAAKRFHAKFQVNGNKTAKQPRH